MARPKKVETLDTKGIREKDGKYYWDLVRVLPSGQRWRKASEAATMEKAITTRAAALAEFEKLKAGESVIAEQGYTVETWCEHCLTNVMPHTANNRGKPYDSGTLDDYRSVLNRHVYPRLGAVRLTSLNTDHLDSLMAKVPSLSLKVNVKKVVGKILTLAEERGKRPRNTNPCRAIRLPNQRDQRTSGKVIKHTARDPQDGRKTITVETPVADGLIIETVRVLTFEEEATLLDYVRNHPAHSDYLTLLMLGLKLGLRIGEALALDWDAVDFNANTVRIDQQVQREKGKGVKVKDTKSKAGNRVIPMPKSLSAYLTGVKLLSESPHVVCNSLNKRRDANRAQGRIKELMIGAGVGDKVVGRRFVPRPTYHDLRRSFLTRLATGHVAPGVMATPVPPTILIRVSGHEDVETLLSYYTSADDSMVTAAMSSMP